MFRVLACLLTLLAVNSVQAGALAERIAQRSAERNGIEIIRNQAYGPLKAQRMDIYRPKGAKHAPIIVMVHGGGWRVGDKAMRSVVTQKVAHWVGAGALFVSINYRLVPDANPVEQAGDLARAVAALQRTAADYGGDANRMVLMGHSAGAHLVSLLGASVGLQRVAGVRPWMATVSLDSAAYDVVAIMRDKHLRLYDDAFGADEAFWRSASPLHQLTTAGPPQLGVCSSTRADDPCDDARNYRKKTKSVDMVFDVLPIAKTHREINTDLGKDPAYTRQVDAFLRGIDPHWPVTH